MAVGLIDSRGHIAVGIWILGIAFPLLLGRAVFRQRQLAAALEATRRELAEQAMLEERRRIARDVHDFVGHGLAAVMLQVTSARHVLRRDPAAAEQALRSAEVVGRRSMQELRRTVEVLRSDGEAGALSPVPSAMEIPALVDHAQAGARWSNCGSAATFLRSRRALAWRCTGSSRSRWRTQLVMRRWRGLRSRWSWRTRMFLSSPRPPTRARRAGQRAQRRRYGLIGMRERATALGGEFAAGPTSEGWRVSCQLPLETAGGAPRAGPRN